MPASAKRGSNINSVTIITSGNEAASMSMAADLSDVLDDAAELRVLPVAGHGPIQSLADLLYLDGIDAAIIPADALAYAQRHQLLGGKAKKVRYVAKLGSNDIHILARAGIVSLSELKGKKVDTGSTGEDRFASASMIFDTLGIAVEAAPGPESAAIERIKKGEIEAAVLCGRKPLAALAKLGKADGLTLLSVPPHIEFSRVYTPQILDKKDYPGLIGDKQMVDGVSVGTVLAVFDWPQGTPGFNKIKALSSNLFGNTEVLNSGERRVSWSDINFAASVPGWTRYAPVSQWLKKSEPQVAAPEKPDIESDFSAFVAKAGGSQKGSEEALFARFLEWQKKNTAVSKGGSQ
jgi:TRAP-type uncharacterized transport system substrate-binding protein